MSQVNSSVTSYFTKIKKLWDEYVNLLEDCVCECGSSVAVSKVIQDQQVIQFLMGLNESFNTVRGNILIFSPPLNLNEVYQLI